MSRSTPHRISVVVPVYNEQGGISSFHDSLVKRSGSKLFYGLFNRFTHLHLVPGATDYRLIDKVVQADFVRLTEHNRITRGLIDWLGYDRSYVAYTEKPRMHDQQAIQ